MKELRIEDVEDEEIQREGGVGLFGLLDFLTALLARGPKAVEIGGGVSEDDGSPVIFMVAGGVEFVVPLAAVRFLADIAEDGARLDPAQNTTSTHTFIAALRMAAERGEEDAGKAAGREKPH